MSLRDGRRYARMAVVVLVASSLAVVMGATAAQAADPEDRVVDLLDAAAVNGTLGVYLRDIDGATIADFNESFVFEPASTIKALIHFHAMRQVQVNPGVTLLTQVPWFAGPANYNNSPPPGTSCPDNSTLPGSDTLSNGLGQMMGPSDNRWTQAMRDFFGDPNIDATRAGFGMTDTALIHTIGCGNAAIANPNQLTLVDAGLMYESVVDGFLDQPTRTAAYNLMTQDNATFNAIVDAEAAGIGLDPASIAAFKAQRQSANKAGSYGLSDGQYRSVAGWSTVPWKDTVTCEVDVRDYVYGAFIHQADSITMGFSIRATGAELLREDIAAALETWEACEADLEITSTIVVDPPVEIDVNTPTVLTVRVAMRNNGPADTIDAVLDRTATVPADCTVNPTDASTPVPAMAQGMLVVQEMDFTVECSQPSDHLFSFASEISPAVAAVVEPDLTNNDGLANANIAVIARADLAVTDWDLDELDGFGPFDLLVGNDVPFAAVMTIANFGDTIADLYPDPVDTMVTRSIDVPDGVRASATVTADEGPADITIQRPGDPDVVLNNQPPGTTVEADGPATIIVEFAADALAVDELRPIEETFGLRCLAPGLHDIAFVGTITAIDEHVVDPDETNNALGAMREIECVLPVAINIRPGNKHNFVNPNGNQTLPVAVLTTAEGEYGLPLAFDATTIDHTTARFGTVGTLEANGGSSPSPDKAFVRDTHELDDKTKDGDDDMVMLFGVPATGIEPGTTEACVTGSYLGEGGAVLTFFGCDFVQVKP